MLTSFTSPARSGILLAIVLVLAWRWLPRGLRIVALAPLVGCVLLATPMVANPLVHFIESRIASSQCVSPLPETIVVLGGGSQRDAANDQDVMALAEMSLRRLIVAAALQRETPESTLVISGGVARYDTPESVLMGAMAERLGVPHAALRFELESRTTWQNAQFVAALQPPVARRIRLVTSDIHLPRAVYAFEQAGFEVCAVGAGSLYSERDDWGYFLPSTSALEKSDAALHELLGDAAYRAGWLRGLTRNPWATRDNR